QIADLTDKLLKFPAVNKGNAPSVMADTNKSPTEKPDVFAVAAKDGALEKLDLGENNFSKWRAVNKEVTLQAVKAADLSPERQVSRMTVNVDHKIDGGGEAGKYPIGWPRIRRDFGPNEIVLTDYDYLTFNVKIDSDRDEVADDFTPFVINFSSYEGGHEGFKGDVRIDLGDRQRTWFPVRVSINDMIKRSGREWSKWKHLKGLQLVVEESKYKDGTKLQFDIDQLALVKVKHPIIETVECSDVILLPAKYFIVGIAGMGMSSLAKNSYQLAVNLCDMNGKVVAAKNISLSSGNNVALNLTGIAAGQYRLETMITDKAGKTVSSQNRNIKAVAGY
ncbi:MAG: hypothetical protein WC071_11275, partial [Victivallaceae bacterium]